jgi:hypothetical protein
MRCEFTNDIAPANYEFSNYEREQAVSQLHMILSGEAIRNW